MNAAFAFDLTLYAICLAGPVFAVRLTGWLADDGLTQIGVGLVLGLFGVPMLAYTLAVAGQTHIHQGLLLGSCAAIVAAGGLVHLARRRWS